MENSKPYEKEDYTENSFLPEKIPGAEESNSCEFSPKSNVVIDAATGDNRNVLEDTSYSFPMVHLKKPSGFNTVDTPN